LLDLPGAARGKLRRLNRGTALPTSIDDLLSILDLEVLEHNLFRGISRSIGLQRVFGGQVISQALVAASRTVDDTRLAHSLHAYFILPGDVAAPIVYQVERTRDGGSFTTRRVLAIQHGRPIFSMSASFHVEEPGFEHHPPMPEVPPPEDLPGEDDLKAAYAATAPGFVARYWEQVTPIEVRPVVHDRYQSRAALEPAQRVWVRTSGRIPDDPRLHRCCLAYISDMLLVDTALFPHGKTIFDPTMQVASLDHAMWFHQPFRADEWLLYVCESPIAHGARGFTRGSLFTRDGRLVASTAQEGLIREKAREPG